MALIRCTGTSEIIDVLANGAIIGNEYQLKAGTDVKTGTGNGPITFGDFTYSRSTNTVSITATKSCVLHGWEYGNATPLEINLPANVATTIGNTTGSSYISFYITEN